MEQFKQKIKEDVLEWEEVYDNQYYENIEVKLIEFGI